MKDRAAFTRALDELQTAMIVVPSEAVYVPKFTYLWTLAIGRFSGLLRQRVSPNHALRTPRTPYTPLLRALRLHAAPQTGKNAPCVY